MAISDSLFHTLYDLIPLRGDARPTVRPYLEDLFEEMLLLLHALDYPTDEKAKALMRAHGFDYVRTSDTE